VKGHPITFGQILADFVVSYSGNPYTNTSFSQEKLCRWAEEMS
jgi:hypothetical protein